MADDKVKNGDLEKTRKKVKERADQEAASYPKETRDNGKISSAFIDACLNANELGSGLLYAAIHRDKFVFNNTTGEWLVFNGHTWERDTMEQALAAVEDVVDRLLEEMQSLGEKIECAIKEHDQDKVLHLEAKRARIIKWIYKLRETKGRNACLLFARTCKDPLAVEGKEFDRNPWLLGCANGVIDLRTGELHTGRPEQYISKASPVEWKGLNEPAPTWERFLEEILEGHKEVIAFLQRSLGYSMAGLSREHMLLILHGRGWNGKGTLIETLGRILGPLASPIPAEMLLDQGKAKNSGGPTPDIMMLQGLRFAFASETDENRRFSPSRVKWLTGADTLTGRNPYDKRPLSFEPTHTLVLLTNNKPSAPPEDFAFWERVYLITFRLSFVNRDPVAEYERPVDLDMMDKLKKEASGILAWLVRGTISYLERGLEPPEEIWKETAEYRRDEDLLADFLEEYCDLTDLRATSSATELYDRAAEWWRENVSEKKELTQTRFGRMMRKRFDRTKIAGKNYYVGIALK